MKILVAVLTPFALFGISYWSMTAGWGLEVQSWPAVVGSWLAVWFITLVAEAIKS